MRKLLFLLFTLSLYAPSQAQEFSGDWIMGYIKAKQPIFTMISKDGQMMLEDETPQDSAYIFGPGLMLLKARGKKNAVSFSWDGVEKWEIEYLEDQIRFNGKTDTLYGNFNEDEQLILSSTLDDRPTEYVFVKTDYPQQKYKLLIEGDWNVEGEANYLTGHQLSFKKDSLMSNQQGEFGAEGEYFIHPLGSQFAVEYVVNYPSTYIGILYITEFRVNSMKGVFYAVVEDDKVPERVEITLLRN